MAVSQLDVGGGGASRPEREYRTQMDGEMFLWTEFHMCMCFTHLSAVWPFGEMICRVRVVREAGFSWETVGRFWLSVSVVSPLP